MCDSIIGIRCLTQIVEHKFSRYTRRTITITTRDIKVFIFSILFSTLCYALFNQPLKSAEAQGREARDGGGRDICREHAQLAGEKHDAILAKLDELLSR